MNTSLVASTIAEEMSGSISALGDSDVADAFYSLLNGTWETLGDYGYLAYDFIDTDSRYQKNNDKHRIAKLVKDGINSEKVNRALHIVYEDYYKNLTEEQQQLLSRRQTAGIAGGAVANNFLFKNVTGTLLTGFFPRFFTGLTITTTYTLGGKIARSTYGSQQLMNDAPELYWKLRSEGDLDLLYFLIEKYAEPFVKASKIKKTNPALFEEINNKFLSLEL